MSSKPSARTLLLLLIILFWLLAPEFRCQCTAVTDSTNVTYTLAKDEVSALQTITSNLELRSEQKSEYCKDDSRYICECREDGTCWITRLELSNLGLTGIIHEAVGNLGRLRYLYLDSNKLHGSIPDSLGNLWDLLILDLSFNQLSGSIPPSLGSDGNSLEELYLDHNLLSGTIPRSFGSLVNLTSLYLQFNMLSGAIPDELGNLANLTDLDLSENQLRGPLPDALGNLGSLETLRVSANYLTGEFPESYGRLTNLIEFSISGNYISGPLPVKSITNWTNIQSVYLVGNNFTGTLTKEVFNLPYLQYLLISDLANDGVQLLPPKITKSADFESLVLRNCSISGPIPKYISDMSSLEYLDLSFNNLTGGLPEYMKSESLNMSVSGNMLNGTIPDWIIFSLQTMDLSFNNFSAIESGASRSPQLNLFACCRNSSNTEPEMMEPQDMMNTYCPGGKKQEHHSLFINCGGGETTFLGNKYDQDNATSLFYTSPQKNWAYSITADIGLSETNSSDYIKNVTCGSSIAEVESLYDKARLSPQSLKYYAFCLRKGKYNVTLHFAEIVYTEDADYTSLMKRAFDVYIQGELRLSSFDIKNKAGGPDKPTSRNFSHVVVNDSLLEIHLYWPGKGSLAYGPTSNGPLLSAISVTPEFKIGHDKHKALYVALVAIASVIVALLLLLAFAWKMGWVGSAKPAKIRIGHDDELQADKFVTVKELIAATERFSDNKKLGEGGSGTVYKAQLQGYTVAVKRLLSSQFKERIEQLKNEIRTISALQHNNLLELLDVHIGKELQLIVYEYMENKSLADALFDSTSRLKLTWATRVNICLGIARGLKYLHEHDRVKIVHTNIKSANILLDGNLEAKISDFGFASLYTDEDQVLVIKREVSQGYMAPEYFQKNVSLTSKADVYSFGVVILEIVSGKRNINKSKQESELLLDRAYKAQAEGNLKGLVDKNLSSYDEKQALEILYLAVVCTTLAPSVRPKMSEIVSVLLREKSINEVVLPAKATRVLNAGSNTSTELASITSTSSPSTKGTHELESIL